MLTPIARTFSVRNPHMSVAKLGGKSHLGCVSEQLRSLVTSGEFLSPAPAFGLTDSCVTKLSDSQGCKISDFALVLCLRHNGRESSIHSACSMLLTGATPSGFSLGPVIFFKVCIYFFLAFQLLSLF